MYKALFFSKYGGLLEPLKQGTLDFVIEQILANTNAHPNYPLHVVYDTDADQIVATPDYLNKLLGMSIREASLFIERNQDIVYIRSMD